MRKQCILLIGHWFGSCVGAKFAEGFRQADCEVFTAGTTWGHYTPWAGGTMIAQKFVPDVQFHEARLPSYHEIMDALADMHCIDGVDLVVHFDPHLVVKEAPVPRVLYMADSHVRAYDPQQFDLVFGAHSWGVCSDEANFRWLPLAHNPKECFDMGQARTIDVALVGCMYEYRLEAIKFLLRKDVTLLLGWGRVGEERNSLYNQARMALVVTHSGDLSDRLFANMAQGCLVLADRGIRDLDKLGAQEGLHYLAFGEPYEMLEQVQRGRDSDYRKTITTWAKEWVKPHTFAARASEILKEVFVQKS